MILIISTCKEKLHELEFVKPIEKILKEINVKYFIKNYKKISKEDLGKSEKIIISGTSLKDNEFIKGIEKFNWIKNYDKPLLGICAGMQIIGLIFGGKLRKKREIGYYKENFVKNFLGLENEYEVYHLHNYYISLPKDFEVYSESIGKIPQAIKHKSKKIYGVLFHPEVRNRKLIEKFKGLA